MARPAKAYGEKQLASMRTWEILIAVFSAIGIAAAAIKSGGKAV